jgi:3-dehydroquinate dehydratase/shikimate dehydrogenase
MSSSLLCETVTGRSMADLQTARDAAVADMVELRLDGIRDLNVAAALDRRNKPVVVTCRPQWEGGRFSGTEEERHRILAEALALGAEFVDVEWAALHAGHQPNFADIVQVDPSRIVVSSHDLRGSARRPAGARTGHAQPRRGGDQGGGDAAGAARNSAAALDRPRR